MLFSVGFTVALQIFFHEIYSFVNGRGPHILNYRSPFHPDVIVYNSFPNNTTLLRYAVNTFPPRVQQR